LLPLLTIAAFLLLLVENPYYIDMILMTFFYAAMGMAWNFIAAFVDNFLWGTRFSLGSAVTARHCCF